MKFIKLIVLDLLKPHDISIIELAADLSGIEGVEGVDIAITDTEKEVEKAKVTIMGDDIRYDLIKDLINKAGAAIHGIDKVAAGKKLIKEASTPQD